MMMTIEQLAERIRRVVELTQSTGITLWGGRDSLLVIAETLGGEVIEVAPKRGCTNESCGHFSHDPAASTYKWVPPQGVSLIYLGGETDSDGDLTEYFAAKRDDTVYFLKTWDSRFYHGSVRIVDVDEVPEWALLELYDAD